MKEKAVILWEKYKALPLWVRAFLTFLAALLTRIIFFMPPSMELDGHFFCRMAMDITDNLKMGKIFTAIPLHDNYYGIEYRPFLFSLLGAFVSLITGNVQWALIIVSMLSGAVTAVFAFYLGREIYGDPAGEISSLLIIFHPGLIYMSSMGLSDSLYTALYSGAVLFTLYGVIDEKKRDVALSALFFGLSYLVRFEALAGAAVAGFLFLLKALGARIADKSKNAPAPAMSFRNLLIFVLLFFIVISPYLWILHLSAGGFHLTSPAKQIYDLSEGLYMIKGERGGYRQFNYLYGAPGEYPYRKLLEISGADGAGLYRRNSSLILKEMLNRLPQNLWVARSNFSWFWILLIAIPVFFREKRSFKESCLWVFVAGAIPALIFQFWDPSPRYFAFLVPVFSVFVAGVALRLFKGEFISKESWYYFVLFPLSVLVSWYLWMPVPFRYDFLQFPPDFSRQLGGGIVLLAGVAVISGVGALICRFVLKRVSLFFTSVLTGAFLMALFAGPPMAGIGIDQLLTSVSFDQFRGVLLLFVLAGLYLEGAFWVKERIRDIKTQRNVFLTMAFILLMIVSVRNTLTLKQTRILYNYAHFNGPSSDKARELTAKPGVMCAFPVDALNAGGTWIKLPMTHRYEVLKEAILREKPDYIITGTGSEELGADISMIPALTLLKEEGIIKPVLQEIKKPPFMGVAPVWTRLFAAGGKITAEKPESLQIWPHCRGDLMNSGRSIYRGPGRGAKVRWKYKTGHEIFSSPAVDREGRVLFGSDDSSVYCVGAHGRLQWKKTTGYYVSAPGALSDDGIFYIGSNDQNLYAFSPSGEVIWKFPTGYYISAWPLLLKDCIILGGEDHNLYAVNYHGREIFRRDLSDEILGGAALMPDGKSFVVAVKNGMVHCFSLSGSLLWKFKVGGPITGGPAVEKSGIIYFGCADGNIYSVDSRGRLRWKFKTGGPVECSPAIDEKGNLYAGSKDSYLYSVDPSGKMLWRFKTGYHVESSPVLDKAGRIYFGSHDRCIYGLDEKGEMMFRIPTGAAVITSPAIGPDGCLYAGSMDGCIYRIDDLEE